MIPSDLEKKYFVYDKQLFYIFNIIEDGYVIENCLTLNNSFVKKDDFSRMEVKCYSSH